MIQLCTMVPTRHSRAGGNQGIFELVSRLRGSDIHYVTYFWDTTIEPISKGKGSTSG